LKHIIAQFQKYDNKANEKRQIVQSIESEPESSFIAPFSKLSEHPHLQHDYFFEFNRKFFSKKGIDITQTSLRKYWTGAIRIADLFEFKVPSNPISYEKKRNDMLDMLFGDRPYFHFKLLN
jgi:hypothetical protein